MSVLQFRKLFGMEEEILSQDWKLISTFFIWCSSYLTYVPCKSFFIYVRKLSVLRYFLLKWIIILLKNTSPRIFNWKELNFKISYTVRWMWSKELDKTAEAEKFSVIKSKQFKMKSNRRDVCLALAMLTCIKRERSSTWSTWALLHKTILTSSKNSSTHWASGSRVWSCDEMRAHRPCHSTVIHEGLLKERRRRHWRDSHFSGSARLVLRLGSFWQREVVRLGRGRNGCHSVRMWVDPKFKT